MEKSKEKQMLNDLIEIFDEEYSKRHLITPQNTAEKMTAKGYRKASDVAREIFEDIEKSCRVIGGRHIFNGQITCYLKNDIDELKKKYTEGSDADKARE